MANPTPPSSSENSDKYYASSPLHSPRDSNAAETSEEATREKTRSISVIPMNIGASLLERPATSSSSSQAKEPAFLPPVEKISSLPTPLNLSSLEKSQHLDRSKRFSLTPEPKGFLFSPPLVSLAPTISLPSISSSSRLVEKSELSHSAKKPSPLSLPSSSLRKAPSFFQLKKPFRFEAMTKLLSFEGSKAQFRNRVKDLLIARLRNWGDVPSLTPLRVHHLIYKWLSQFKEAEFEDDRTIKKILAGSKGKTEELMALVFKRLEAQIQKAKEMINISTENENSTIYREQSSWIAKQIDLLTAFHSCDAHFCSFLDLLDSLRMSRTRQQIIVEAIGGEKALAILRQLHGKEAAHFARNRLKSYRQEEPQTTTLRCELSEKSLPWEEVSIYLLDEMSFEEALRGICTNLAVVFDGLEVQTSDGTPVKIPQANGAAKPLGQPQEYGVGDAFEGKEAFLYDLVKSLSAAGYRPLLEFEAAILDLLEKALNFAPPTKGFPSMGHASTIYPERLQQGCPSSDIIVVTSEETAEISYYDSNGESRHAATLSFTWVFTFRRQSHNFECTVIKNFQFEPWVSVEERPEIEEQIPKDKMPLARAIAKEARKAGYNPMGRFDILMNVRRVLSHKFTGVSRVIAALSNGGFAPAAHIHHQAMNLEEKYKLQFLQGRFNTVRILAPQIFEVTAKRTAKIFHRFFDAAELTIAQQTLHWTLLCDEEKNSISGKLTMDLTFEPWVPNEKRIKILKRWQSGTAI